MQNIGMDLMEIMEEKVNNTKSLKSSTMNWKKKISRYTDSNFWDGEGEQCAIFSISKNKYVPDNDDYENIWAFNNSSLISEVADCFRGLDLNIDYMLDQLC